MRTYSMLVTLIFTSSALPRAAAPLLPMRFPLKLQYGEKISHIFNNAEKQWNLCPSAEYLTKFTNEIHNTPSSHKIAPVMTSSRASKILQPHWSRM